jgi:hypothetical protein
MAATIETVTKALKLPRKVELDEIYALDFHPAAK